MKRFFTHIFLILVVSWMLLPLYIAFVAASNEAKAMMQLPTPFLPGDRFMANIVYVLTQGLDATNAIPLWRMLTNSFIMACLIAVGKIACALFSAFSLVYFELPWKKLFFMLIFATMMVPIEVRIVPTFQLVASFGWINQFSGLTLPLMASATATFLFRQFFKTLPKSLVDAAKLDGAGPWRFFWDILLPLSKKPIAALFIILFVYGWNQYLWPLVVTTDTSMSTVVMGIRYLSAVADEVPQWNLIMTIALLAMFLPCLLVVGLQYWFEEGLKR